MVKRASHREAEKTSTTLPKAVTGLGNREMKWDDDTYRTGPDSTIMLLRTFMSLRPILNVAFPDASWRDEEIRVRTYVRI